MSEDEVGESMVVMSLSLFRTNNTPVVWCIGVLFVRLDVTTRPWTVCRRRRETPSWWIHTRGCVCGRRRQSEWEWTCLWRCAVSLPPPTS